ncbi:undecaprenyldiphospho-muramoylpentapeptide beta-N-acetylglucosaminyltransferase [Psittacicella gerlachiana]|uniref:UDP-N-acetylglucosamine--N-acetylmuramyl-(pentapeptide) pyrophosphoryl-undecaprenol N-acetylglucosamine transferase n=1 Tax=Psittacicella gerlachiana TaxID=2028574 RepID=A0A3A1YJN3_9GAMM|nr:undecaprenyldiphospho-muramoylpentapeptide beta-N-acetylglucosaminyltransferase [Psittacicella gerlachiana]RIY37875.1 undecaprenyldiphospho-muramoylpentapeptide beta-N-acetylglucosaminyltransferase [Psittacicella gerlachiana]
MTKKKVLIMAGGTGGHIFPALAIAQKLTEQNIEIAWVGTENRMEANLVPKYGYPIYFIEIEGLVSRGAKAWLKAPFKILKAIFQAKKIIQEFKPDLVVGTGGYVCGPVGVAAKLTKTPLIVVENNGVIGLTNKILSKFADLTLFSYPLKEAKKPEYIVGQPLREDFTKLKSEENLQPLLSKAQNEYQELVRFVQEQLNYQQALPDTYTKDNFTHLYELLDAQQKLTFNNLSLSKQRLNILAVGGSLGARILNQNLAPAIKNLETKGIKVNTLQQVGQGNLDEVNNLVTELSLENYTVCEFIDNISEKYLQSDLIICRSGSMTVFEIANCNRPAIFVPLALQKDQQQLHNAKYLTDKGAGLLILNKDFNAQSLTSLIENLNYHQLYQIALKQTSLATPEATDKIVKFIQPYLNR